MPGAAGRDPRAWWGSAWIVAGLVALSAACYAGTLDGELVFDDRTWIPGLESIRDPSNLARIFGERFFGAARPDDTLWRPLTTLSLAINWWANELLGLAGTAPAGYRVVNVALHAWCGVLLWRFLGLIGLPRAASLGAAALFVAHPIVTEAVTPIVNRSESLSLLFGLCFLIAHRRRHAPVRAGFLWLLALWSKESAIAFGPIAAALDLVLPAPEPRRRLAVWGLYAAVAVLWLGLRAAVIGDAELVVPFLSNPLAHSGAADRVRTAAWVQLVYLQRLLLPVGLSADHSHAQIPLVTSWLAPRFLGFAAVASLAVSAAVLLRRRAPLVAFGVLAYAIAFAPTSNLAFPIGTVLGERLAYTPLVFFLVLVAAGLAHLGSRASLVVSVAAVAACAFLTIARNRTWHDEGAFYTALVASSPDSALAHYGIARCRYQPAGDLEGAIRHYRRAIEIWPAYRDAWNNLAVAQRDAGRLHEASATYAELLQREPGYARGWYGLGMVQSREGQPARAAESFERAIALDPSFLEPYVILGRIRAEHGDTAAAERLWRRALELDPGNPAASRNLEILRGNGGPGR